MNRRNGFQIPVYKPTTKPVVMNEIQVDLRPEKDEKETKDVKEDTKEEEEKKPTDIQPVIKKLVKLDNSLRINAIAAEEKKSKELLEKQVLSYCTENELCSVNVDDGRFIVSESKSTDRLSKELIIAGVSKEIRKDIEKKKEALNRIKTIVRTLIKQDTFTENVAEGLMKDIHTATTYDADDLANRGYDTADKSRKVTVRKYLKRTFTTSGKTKLKEMQDKTVKTRNANIK